MFRKSFFKKTKQLIFVQFFFEIIQILPFKNERSIIRNLCVIMSTIF